MMKYTTKKPKSSRYKRDFNAKLEPMDQIFADHPFFSKRAVISVYKLQKHWQSLVGEMMAKRSQPVRVKKACLIIAVENQAWGQQFGMMKPMLLKAIEEKLKLKYDDIRFVSEKFKRVEPFVAYKKKAFKKDDRSLEDILADIAKHVGKPPVLRS